MKLSLAIQTPEVPQPLPVTLLSGTFEEKLAKAAHLSVDGVELMSSDPARLDADTIHAALDRYGLTVAAVGSGAIAFATGLTLLHADPAKAQQARARLGELIRFAAAVHAPLVTIGSFRGRVFADRAQSRARLITLLRSAADEAAAYGVRLALEPLNRYEADLIRNVDEGLAFWAEVAHPALGLLLDTYHVNIEESSWIEPFRRVMTAGCLWHIHLGDNNRLPPGCGLISFPAIVATLREIGYQGFLSAELLAQPDPDTAARQTVMYMRALLSSR